MNVKVNDKYAFSSTIDLNKFVERGPVNLTTDYTYDLYGVLVHSGDVHGGHYYAFIRPTTELQFFRFDDDRVTRATEKQAIEDNFGGDEEYTYHLHGKRYNTTHKKFANAYMLVYMRRCEVPWIMSEITESDIPEKLRQKFEEERLEEERKKKKKLIYI